ncbi:MAG: hypothetical protein ACFFG0_26270 [Candidatus Thorarchaeota archaeon]
MKKFQINEFITLKLEGKKTNIYVNKKLFIQCKHLLMDINIKESDLYEDIGSIDNAIENLSNKYEIELPPEIEFWGHCSNIQTWVENNYNTDLLEMKIAFPLLKALSDAGDKRARIRLNEEVIRRFNEGDEKVKEYLLFENFFLYLEDYDKFSHLLVDEDNIQLIDIINKCSKKIKIETFIPLRPKQDLCYIVIKKKRITQMGLWIDNILRTIPNSVSKLKSLTTLGIFTNVSSINIPNIEYKNIEYLTFYLKEDQVTAFRINNINSFPNLKSLGFYSEKKPSIKPRLFFSDNIEKLKKLEVISIVDCTLEKFPEFVQNLTSLKWFIIRNSKMSYLPNNLFNLKSLEVVMLEGTNLQIIPDSIINNESIKYFACEPYLISEKVRLWIKKQELQLFKNKTYKKKGFFNFPA